MTSNSPTIRHLKPQLKMKRNNPKKFKMKRSLVKFITVLFIATLPYSSTLSLPSGDPAPGRSPGPPQDDKADDSMSTTDAVYDDTTISDVEVTTVSDTSDIDACAFARIPSDSDDIVTISELDSDVNLTISHPVFDTEELVKGVVYDGK